jgi:signal transduction histidine kinase
LLLTRIDNRGFDNAVTIDAGAILRRLADDYGEIYSHRHLTVALNEDAPLHLTMNETLAGVLLGNLLKNAFLHSPDGGMIEVRVSARGVSISNSATAGPLDPVVIFRRFYRSGNAGEGSAGLGLALVESICRFYDMHTGYDFADGRHTFSVTV